MIPPQDSIFKSIHNILKKINNISDISEWFLCKIRKKYSKKGFEILSISISDTKEQLEKFLKAYKIDYPVLYGNQSEMQKVIMDYGGVYSIPTSFLIGKNNEIKRIYPGAILKQYDPNMYSDLVYTIESSLAEEHKKDSGSDK